MYVYLNKCRKAESDFGIRFAPARDNFELYLNYYEKIYDFTDF